MYEEELSQMPAKFEPGKTIYRANSTRLGIIAEPFTVQLIAEVYVLMDAIETVRASTDGVVLADEQIK